MAGMPAAEVARIVDWLEGRSVVYQCNGGWAVDALAGRQTRTHGDLDVFLDNAAVPDAVTWLEEDGCRLVEDWLPVRVELRSGERAVDLHPMRVEANGDGVQSLLDGGTIRHAAASRTVGVVDGRTIVVADAVRLLELREGYEPRAIDRHDVALLRALGV